MKKKVFSLLMATLLMFGISGSAVATEEINPAASYYLDDYYVALGANGDGQMVIAVSVNGVGVQDKIGVQQIDIEKKVNGSWKYCETMDGVEHPEFYSYNSREYVNEITFSGDAGYTYRVRLTVYAKKGSGSDTGYITSPSAVCK